MTKEEFYDTHISPLMADIIRLCKERGINSFATFALDDRGEGDGPLYCTTSLPIDKTCDGFNKVERLYRELRGRNDFAALTIMSGPK